MTFSLADHWVWDFWTALDNGIVHLYYLRAPKSLGDPELRHRNASIGHATSTDYLNWTDHGVVLERGGRGDPDESATWTGSVFRDPAGLWRMFYTGSRFLSDESSANIETILMATSSDLHSWTKQAATVLSAAGDWYETLADSSWREEAWRDPWVEPDSSGSGWHLLVTARARPAIGCTDTADVGVIGHAVSSDLTIWSAAPPLSTAGAGFAHLEVPQLARIDGREALIFSCDSSHLAGARKGQEGGVWGIALENGTLFSAPPIDAREAHLIVGEQLYAGRVVYTDAGPALLGFENVGTDGEFIGRLSDPWPLRWTLDGRLVAEPADTRGPRQAVTTGGVASD